MLNLAYVAVFLAAFLLFQVELIISKAVLPGFGGSYLVWAACVTCFQFGLLAGYGYAYFLAGRMRSMGWRIAHTLLCLSPLLLFPLDVESLRAPPGGVPQVVAIAWMLVSTVGPAFVVLAAIGVTMQQRVAQAAVGRSVNAYVLYAVSNLGSFLGLLSYPLVVEPLSALEWQLSWWRWAWLFAVLMHLATFWGLPRAPRMEFATAARQAGKTAPSASIRQRATWLTLSAAGSAMFLSTTNALTIDLASAPLLWTLPLAIFLLTFALTFRTRPWLPQAVRQRLGLAFLLGLLFFLMSQASYVMPLLIQIAAYLVILMVVCLVCHAALYESRPQDPGRLSAFYMHVAFGGFVGGAAVSWGAPLAGASLVEYPLAFALAGAGLWLARDDGGGFAWKWVWWRLLCVIGAAVGLQWAVRLWPETPTGVWASLAGVALAAALYGQERRPGVLALAALAVLGAVVARDLLLPQDLYLHTHRNFYGVYRIYDREGVRRLMHGGTLHGMQYVDGPKRATPLTYYHPTTPVGRALAGPGRQALAPLRREAPIALVGLGAGSLLVYAEPGEQWDIMELDPYNEVVAREYFSFIDLSRGDLRMLFGDGRLTLEDQPDGAYGVIVVDAFNSDSIPTHLLTREALALYAAKLTEDGVVFFHLSNKFLDLVPIVQATAKEEGLLVLTDNNIGDTHPDAQSTIWAALTRSPATRDALTQQLGWTDLSALPPMAKPWTDNYTNLLEALR